MSGAESCIHSGFCSAALTEFGVGYVDGQTGAGDWLDGGDSYLFAISVDVWRLRGWIW